MERATEKWKARRRPKLTGDALAGQIKDWLCSGSGAFEGRSVYLVAYTNNELTEEGDRAAEIVKREYGSKIDYFEDWPKLPKDGILVSFLVDGNGRIEHIDDLLERRVDLSLKHIKEDSDLELCFKLGGKDRLTRDKAMWQEVCTWLRKQPFDKRKQGWDSEENSAAGFVDLARVPRHVVDATCKNP